MTSKRTILKRAYIRTVREALEKGIEPPPEPDFKITIPRQPHWTIVRIQRGVHSLLQLLGEGVSQHRVVSIMGIRPTQAPGSFAMFGASDGGAAGSCGHWLAVVEKTQ